MIRVDVTRQNEAMHRDNRSSVDQQMPLGLARYQADPSIKQQFQCRTFKN